MEKIYVLDTSVLLNAGKTALYAFEDNDVVIPIGVVKQLESNAKEGQLAWIAASVLRELEQLRTQYQDKINTGIPLQSGGTLRIELNHVKANPDFPPSAREATNTLLVASNLSMEESNKKPVILVTNDLTQRLVAATLHISAKPFKKASSQGDYTGVSTIGISTEDMNQLYKDRIIAAEQVPEIQGDPVQHGYIVKNLASGNSSLAVKNTNGDLELINSRRFESLPITPRSAEQKIALHHLLNPDVDIVSLGGPAGTGKTLLSLAAGYNLIKLPDSKMDKIVVFRPLQEVGGQELGFLPGTEEEKMLPWTLAIKDALSVWMNPFEINKLFTNGTIEVEPATYIRGRTINNAFIIIDEAQNFERLSLLSMLSRLGAGSKCVLSWDAAQRDNLYINKDDGVVAVVDRMKDEPLVAHTTLRKAERSRAAQMATTILDEMNL